MGEQQGIAVEVDYGARIERDGRTIVLLDAVPMPAGWQEAIDAICDAVSGKRQTDNSVKP